MYFSSPCLLSEYNKWFWSRFGIHCKSSELEEINSNRNPRKIRQIMGFQGQIINQCCGGNEDMGNVGYFNF